MSTNLRNVSILKAVEIDVPEVAGSQNREVSEICTHALCAEVISAAFYHLTRYVSICRHIRFTTTEHMHSLITVCNFCESQRSSDLLRDKIMVCQV